MAMGSMAGSYAVGAPSGVGGPERCRGRRTYEALEESANLPDPDLIAAEIVEDLEAALEQFGALAEELK